MVRAGKKNLAHRFPSDSPLVSNALGGSRSRYKHEEQAKGVNRFLKVRQSYPPSSCGCCPRAHEGCRPPADDLLVLLFAQAAVRRLPRKIYKHPARESMAERGKIVGKRQFTVRRTYMLRVDHPWLASVPARAFQGIVRQTQRGLRRYCCASAKASAGGQEHTRWRSPYTLLIRPTGGQNFLVRVHGAG